MEQKGNESGVEWDGMEWDGMEWNITEGNRKYISVSSEPHAVFSVPWILVIQ